MRSQLRSSPLVLTLLLVLTLARVARADDAPTVTEIGGASDAVAPAPPKEEAATRFNRGVKRYADGDYALALAEFERVYELVPDYHVLYNIAQVSTQLGRYARALRVFQDYLAQGGDSLPPERRAEVQADIANLMGRTARVSVQVVPARAEIMLDGVSVGVSPLAAPLIVDVGEHQLTARADGFVPQATSLSLAGGDQRDASFNLVPLVKPAERAVVIGLPVPRQPLPAMNPAPRPARRNVWIGWASTGVLAASATALELAGASAASQLESDRNRLGVTPNELDAQRSRAKTWLVAADIVGGAAVVAGGVSLYFQLSPRAPAEHASVVSALRLKFAPGRVAVTGEF